MFPSKKTHRLTSKSHTNPWVGLSFVYTCKNHRFPWKVLAWQIFVTCPILVFISLSLPNISKTVIRDTSFFISNVQVFSRRVMNVVNIFLLSQEIFSREAAKINGRRQIIKCFLFISIFSFTYNLFVLTNEKLTLLALVAAILQRRSTLIVDKSMINEWILGVYV